MGISNVAKRGEEVVSMLLVMKRKCHVIQWREAAYSKFLITVGSVRSTSDNQDKLSVYNAEGKFSCLTDACMQGQERFGLGSVDSNSVCTL